MKYSAVIFDLDGTVLDNEEVYSEAFQAVYRKYGIDPDHGSHVAGIGMEANWKRLKEKYKELVNISIIQLVGETQNEYHNRLGKVIVRPGFSELCQALQGSGIIIALATSNNWWMVEDELEDLRLQKYFETVTTGEEVYERKPQPDIYLLTARKLHAEPEECIVIEDSRAGVTAGLEAGMKVVVIRGAHNQNEDFSDASLVIDSFSELNLQILDSIF